MDEQFGNPLVRAIEEIHMPEPVAWWPAAPGWRVLGLLLLAFVLYRFVRACRRWWRNRYRREALRRLEAFLGAGRREALRHLPFLLKATALRAYPRDRVAGLSGEPWLAFLDSRYKGPSFRKDGLLLSVAYRDPAAWDFSKERGDALITMARRWIKEHREVNRV